MSATRTQHLVPGALILLLAAVVTWLSFSREPAEAFLFPRLIASVMLVLALWNFLRAVLGLAKVGNGVSAAQVIALLPGLVVMLVYAFYGAKTFGFYTASAATFIVLYALYDPAPHSSLRAWAKRIIVTGGFMTVIYLLFALLLKVQTPRGLFF